MSEVGIAPSRSAWDAIRFLFERGAFPVDIICGEERLSDDDWGYGPLLYSASERVRLAAEALAQLSFDELVSGVGPETLRVAGIHPVEISGKEDALEFVRGWFDPLAPYFRDAADAGDAAAVWLS